MATSLISLSTSILRPIVPTSLFVLSGKRAHTVQNHPTILLTTYSPGVAIALSGWVVPLLLLPSTPSRTITDQFEEIIRRGYRYLQPSSQLLAVALLATTALTYYHPDQDLAAEWKWYAAAALVLVQVAWYEVVLIFPINDQVIAMGDKLEGDDIWLEEREHAKLHELIRSWRRWHFGRIAAPFVAACLTLAALL